MIHALTILRVVCAVLVVVLAVIAISLAMRPSTSAPRRRRPQQTTTSSVPVGTATFIVTGDSR